MEQQDALIQVIPPQQAVLRLLGGVRRRSEEPIWTDFLIRQPTETGLLLYNTLTLELLHAPRALVPALERPQGALRETLGKKWFLVPPDLDLRQTALELRETLRLMERPREGLEKYTVLTTTACNARCAYCFERQWEPRTMSPETADRTADFILSHSPNRAFRIDWFGGEPLLNRAAMDRICGRLRDEGADYSSNITTNGYLFDPATLREDRRLWRLRQCQITLDGMEETYNRIKQYVYPGGNPFRRVISNIHALAEAGVLVTVRMNFDCDSLEDIRRLTEFLIREFRGQPRVRIYPALLYEYDNGGPRRTPEERKRLTSVYLELADRLEVAGLGRERGLPRRLPTHMCMADSGNMVTVLPEGGLGLCEQYPRDHLIGSLDRPGPDPEVMEDFRRLRPRLSACESCSLYPSCIRLALCPNQICGPEYRDLRIEIEKRNMLKEWKNYIRRTTK